MEDIAGRVLSKCLGKPVRDIKSRSNKTVDVMEEIRDQIKWRKDEYGLKGPNPKQGMTDLVHSAIQGHNLNQEEKQKVIKELKTRKYSVDYNQL